jgi:hypothetical protein
MAVRDPELQATVDRLRDAGCSPETVAAAERYADADAAMSHAIRQARHVDSAEAFMAESLGRIYASIGVPQGPQA